MRILDIDLDFFLNKRPEPSCSEERLNDADIYPWEKSKVERFLEEQCKLSKDEPVNGKIVKHHHYAFYFWRELIEKNILETPFEVIHVDAHSDLGAGFGSGPYIAGELLHKPLEERMYPNCNEFSLNKGSFITFAIACRWISEITIVHYPEWGDDFCWYYWKNNDDSSGYLQLKKYNSPEEFQESFNPNFKTEPIEYEPEVRANKVDQSKYYNSQPFSFINLSVSPEYTPLSSDRLIPVIKKYIEEI